MSLPYAKTPTDDLLDGMGEMEWPSTPPPGFMRSEVCAVVAGDRVRSWSKGKWARRWHVHHSTVTRRIDEVRIFLDEHGGAEWWEVAPGNRRSRRDIFVSFYSLTVRENGLSERGVSAGGARGERGGSAGVDPGAIGIVDEETRGDRGGSAGGARGERGHIARDSLESREGEGDSCQPGQAQPDLFDEDPSPAAPSSSAPTPEAVLEVLNRVRSKLHKRIIGTGHRGLTLKSKRWGPACRRTAKVLRREGLTLGDLEQACRWVYLSEAPQARGARETGEPLETLCGHSEKRLESYLDKASAAIGMPQEASGGEVISLRSPFQTVLTLVSSRGTFGCPSTPAEALELFGDTWALHRAALRFVGGARGEDDTKAAGRGWVTIGRASHDAERAKLGRAYDQAFQAAQRSSA